MLIKKTAYSTYRNAIPVEPIGDPFNDPAEFEFPDGERILFNPLGNPLQFDKDGNLLFQSRTRGKIIFCHCNKWFYLSDARQGFCSDSCADSYRKKRQRDYWERNGHKVVRSERAKAARNNKLCTVCGTSMNPDSAKRAYCSPACRQKAYRRRTDNHTASGG